MTASGSRVQQFILQSIVPILCSVVIGFVFYQGHVFDRHYGAYQFLWSGVVASVFYYLLVYLGRRDAFLGLLLLFFLTLLTTESTRPAFILRDIFYTGAIGISIFTYFRYFRGSRVPNYANPPFVLAGLYAVAYIIVAEIHFAIIRGLAMENTGGSAISLASTTAFFGVLIGFGVGAGIAINEKLASRRRSEENLGSA
jgi:hypothetical protein